MSSQKLGTILLFLGISAWFVYYGLKFFTDANLPFLLFLAWHLLGVLPGVFLRGSKILSHLQRSSEQKS
jgi:hypothetical protein